MLHLKYALLICSVFYVFMHTITGREGSATVGRGVGIKNADIQECTLMSAPQKPFAAMSKWAPSCVIEVALARVSPERGCRSGSTLTSWQTSVSRWAVRSRTSLCLKMGNPPF